MKNILLDVGVRVATGLHDEKTFGVGDICHCDNGFISGTMPLIVVNVVPYVVVQCETYIPAKQIDLGVWTKNSDVHEFRWNDVSGCYYNKAPNKLCPGFTKRLSMPPLPGQVFFTSTGFIKTYYNIMGIECVTSLNVGTGSEFIPRHSVLMCIGWYDHVGMYVFFGHGTYFFLRDLDHLERIDDDQ